MAQRPIIIQKRRFVRGKTKCPCCEHKFKYLLAVDFLLFWDGLCSTCSPAVPDEPPKPGRAVLEELL